MSVTEPVLLRQLERLRLGSIRQHYPAMLAQAAREAWSHERFLAELIAGEATRRAAGRVARRLKAAHLPGVKTLADFDWSWPKQINRAQVQHLFRLEFLAQHGNVILLGGVGVGKTHLAIALAHTACLAAKTALFTTAVAIVNTLAAAQATGASSGRWRGCSSRPCWWSMSWGICRSISSAPMASSRSSASAMSAARRSTSNRAYKHWPEIFNNDSTLTSALLDRLLHHADTLVIEGRSYRLRDQSEA